MIQLNRSMMERYEIPDCRPEGLKAVLFGADRRMLGAAARLLEGVGMACVTRDAQRLRDQDCMFTLLVRGEDADGKRIDEERVVQSILRAVNPETEFEEFLALAESQPECVICHGDAGDVELALLARLLHQCRAKLPVVLVLSDHPKGEAERLRRALGLLARDWADNGWLAALDVRMLLADCLCGPLNDAERARAMERMNYRDDFIAWCEPHAAYAVEGGAPECLRNACGDDYAVAVRMKAQVFDVAVFLCAAAGYLCGMDSFARTLKDEGIRAWIGRAFHDELLPRLPEGRENAIISTFERLENPMNDMPLLEIGRDLLGNFSRTLLPAIRSYAEENLEAPPCLSLSLAAAVMLYAGVRKNSNGEYAVARAQRSDLLHDDGEILESFALLAHDMPAESLAYAVLADRSIWGCDLREIDGLEMRLCYDLSSIQRVGLRETMRMKLQ